jgi:hypothetical protein
MKFWYVTFQNALIIVTVNGAFLCNMRRIKIQFRYNLQSEGRKVEPLAGEIT